MRGLREANALLLTGLLVTSGAFAARSVVADATAKGLVLVRLEPASAYCAGEVETWPTIRQQK